MQYQEITDKELLDMFRDESTKEKAFTQIINKYKEKLYWHIRRMVVSHEDADDILQNVFIKVWKGLDNFREESQLFTWLYRVATNESITLIQKLKKMRAFTVNNSESILSDKIKADEYFDAQKLEWKLQLAIQTLPEQQRLVFNLRYFDEMPYNEMSEILHVTSGSLKASYHHAAKKIEAYLLNH
ncbi:MAG TPA: sigma-70 family RNA polymerase sigma factor [Niabella sp.]|nr:sigma-70 family RNA polymerase sigma factor [Niabella sp.]HQW14267.1 sigma-70 family RNA polymerase sigma factor [Niabella sp.]HQX19667.1 sigma-70 family RNA polymerase sigma factor [Niabella sp.]HRB06892.1 sigma-70 family RNA polymerase sigma factor [Niabella sp.]HRB36700.1 sigma-70 family RNA polymerase sigma factor [Niabella sp.]